MSDVAEHTFDVSIIVPCYQEEGHILESVQKIYEVMNKTKYKFEIIFVEDSSTDKTKEKILQITNQFTNAKYLLHSENTGKGGSIADGAKIANGKFIGHIDIDLDVSADYIPKLLSELESGSDIAIVKRKVKFNINPYYLIRNAAGIFHRSLVKIMLKTPHMDIQSGCKFFKRDVLSSLLNETKSQGWFFDVEIMTRAFYRNYHIKQIDGFYIRNKKKKSTVKLVADGVKQLKMLVQFSKQLKEEKRKGIT